MQSWNCKTCIGADNREKDIYILANRHVKKAGLAAVILILFLSLTGCTFYENVKESITERFTGEEEMEKAVAAVEIFFDLVINEDLEQAYLYISSKDKESRDFEDFTGEFANITKIITIEVNWVELKNNIAVVGIDLLERYDGEEKLFKAIEVSLVKEEDESWKVVFWD